MPKIKNMKWQYGLALFIILLVAGLIWQNWVQRQTIQSLTINQKKTQVDSLQKETTKTVIEYRDRIKTKEKIVTKWRTISDTIINRDTLLVEARNDIEYLDTTLKKCDTALNNCLELSKTQGELITALESKKSPLIEPYVGIGLSINQKIEVSPSLQGGIGVNLNKIFKKKK